MNLKIGQKVIVIAGDEKGKSGKIIKVSKANEFVWVEGLNIITKHTKPNVSFGIKGGISKIEGKIHHSNVKVVTEAGKEEKKSAEIEDAKVKSTKSKSTSKKVEKETK